MKRFAVTLLTVATVLFMPGVALAAPAGIFSGDVAAQRGHVDWPQWMRALGWNRELARKAMDEITDHCERDVIVLEDVYRLLVQANAVRSIRRDGGVL
jgi:hypothetical protein